jgi:N-acetylmuramoyl-L-alanine amidase
MVAVLLAEAGGEGRRGMECVAEVIFNRSKLKGETVTMVVTRSHQFSCLNGTTPGELYSRMKDHEKAGEALKIARVLLTVPEKIPSRVRGATHYENRKLRPAWAKGKIPVAVIGNHAFWKLSE